MLILCDWGHNQYWPVRFFQEPSSLGLKFFKNIRPVKPHSSRSWEYFQNLSTLNLGLRQIFWTNNSNSDKFKFYKNIGF
jgi:hypothetical protein